MLSAQNSKNESILAFELNDDEIEKLKREESFFCSCCNEKVLIKHGKKILKSGKKIITHFAHEKATDCPDSKESQEHLASKITIFESLKKYGITKAYLEKTYNLKNKQELLQKYKKHVSENYSDLKIDDTFFGKLLNRNIFRPDIIFQYNNENIAVEVQKSYLPMEDFLLRTLFYKILNIKVLWIIPNDVLLKKSMKDEYQNVYINISNFHKELKKYYFGNIYAWDYNTSNLHVYKMENIEGYRSTGSMQDGEYGGQYFQEDGGYSFTYKKLKKLHLVHTQDNIIKNFFTKEIQQSNKFNQLIDAKIWGINLIKPTQKIRM